MRARAAVTASLPPFPFAVPQVREISTVAGQLVVIEDRIIEALNRIADHQITRLDGLLTWRYAQT